jgi:hypothetical protein
VRPPTAAVSSTSPSGGAGHLPLAFADLAGCFPLWCVMGVSGMDASGSVSGLVGTSGILAAGTKGWGVVGKKASEFLVVDPVVDDLPAVDMVEG